MDIESRQVLEMGYGGAERITMNMGPQHPSSHGVFRMILTLEGETVIAIDAVIGYLHRCHEKLSETLTYTQYPSIASKTDYVAAMTSQRQCEATRWSSAAMTRRYCARFGTSILPIISAART